MNGAMTFLLIKILKKYHGATYGDLLDMMHEELEKVNESRCFAEKILKKITKNMLLQVIFCHKLTVSLVQKTFSYEFSQCCLMCAEASDFSFQTIRCLQGTFCSVIARARN